MKQYAFIYNPVAGNGRTKSEISKLKKLIGELEGASFFRSKKKGDIPYLVQRLMPDYDIFVACGGDGTIREVAAELINTEKSLGVIPLGSGNDLCKTLQIPTDLQQAFALLREDSTQKIDVGTCNDFIFLNTLGFGFDGLTNQYADKLGLLPAFLRYAIAALKACWTHRKFHVAFQKRKTEDKEVIMLTVANGRVEGGAFWIAPEASLTDGMLDIVQITAIPKLLIPILLPLFLFKKASWIPQIQIQNVSECTLRFDSPIAIHADGETIQTKTQYFEINILPEALTVVSKF